MNILDKIVAEKRREIAALINRAALPELKKRALLSPFKPRGFREALVRSRAFLPVIAEVKKKSPSKGQMAGNFNAARIARAYEQNGAAAISVLTDMPFFGGSPADLTQARRSTACPLLRKDFILNEAQIYESVIAGADAVLLIAALLSTAELRRFKTLCDALGLDALIEVHAADELRKLDGMDRLLVGINNRDLKTFKVDLATTRKLMPKIRRRYFVVSESGIRHYNDLKKLKKYGVRAALVGESLMTQSDPGRALKKLLSPRVAPDADFDDKS